MCTSLYNLFRYEGADEVQTGRMTSDVNSKQGYPQRPLIDNQHRVKTPD
jgi:hypothetical protein